MQAAKSLERLHFLCFYEGISEGQQQVQGNLILTSFLQEENLLIHSDEQKGSANSERFHF